MRVEISVTRFGKILELGTLSFFLLLGKFLLLQTEKYCKIISTSGLTGGDDQQSTVDACLGKRELISLKVCT